MKKVQTKFKQNLNKIKMKINLKFDTNKNKKESFPLVLSIYVSKRDRLYRFSGFFATAE